MSRVIAAAPMANPEAMVVLTAGGGFIDDSMTGFADALAAAFDSAPHIARHFEKLKSDRVPSPITVAVNCPLSCGDSCVTVDTSPLPCGGV
jgi:hypothetical protein